MTLVTFFGNVVTDNNDDDVDVPKLLVVVNENEYRVFDVRPLTYTEVDGYDDDP